MEVMIRDVTGTALSPEQSSLYEAKFKILHEKYTNLIRNIPAQTQIRTNLLSAINAHLSTIEEHKKLIRKSTYRGVRFGKRVRKHAERLKNVLDYLTRDVSNRIDTIKAARLNMKK